MGVEAPMLCKGAKSVPCVLYIVGVEAPMLCKGAYILGVEAPMPSEGPG